MTSRRDRGFENRRRDVVIHVATWQRGDILTSRRENLTSRRDREGHPRLVVQ